MAAFIIGTKVVHADRPKVDTYLRLDELVSAADLDLAIEAQVKAHPLAAGHQCTDVMATTAKLQLDVLCASVFSRLATEQLSGFCSGMHQSCRLSE